jgi:hypothetical protein
MDKLLNETSNYLLDYVTNELNDNKKKRKVKYIIDTVVNLGIENVKVYFYTLMAILLIIFLLQCFQFYYYTNFFKKSFHKNLG